MFNAYWMQEITNAVGVNSGCPLSTDQKLATSFLCLILECSFYRKHHSSKYNLVIYYFWTQVPDSLYSLVVVLLFVALQYYQIRINLQKWDNEPFIQFSQGFVQGDVQTAWYSFVWGQGEMSRTVPVLLNKICSRQCSSTLPILLPPIPKEQ